MIWVVLAAVFVPGAAVRVYALDAPTPLSPSDGTTTTIESYPPLGIPEFTWAPVSGATRYRIQVSGDIAFASLIVNDTTTNTRYTPTSAGSFSDGTWYWRVRVEAPSPASDYSAPMAFTKQWAAATNAPTLSSPASGATVDFYNKPAFSWEPVTGAAYYKFQIAATPGFSSLLVNQTTLATTYQPDTKLTNGSYYWRVVPVDGGAIVHDGTPSEARPFNAGYNRVPTPLEPADGATPAFTPTFRWTAVPGAQFYRLQYSTDPAFFTSVSSVDTRNTTYTPLTALPNDVNYYWRVQAYSGSSISDWSTTRSFVKQWYTQPVLLIPVNNFQYSRDAFFSWTPVPGASYYKIEVNKISSTSFPPTGGNGWSRTTVNTFFVKPDWGWESAPTWYWRVIPYDSNGNPGQASNVSSFGYNDAGAPDLVSPLYYYTPDNSLQPHEDRTVGVPIFNWQRLLLGADKADQATAYRVQVDTLPTFSSVDWTFDTQNLSAVPTAAYPFTPSVGGIYYWRVRPLDGIGGAETGQWSQTWQTRVDTTRQLTATSAIALLRPAPAAEFVETTPLMEWWPLQGADSYDVQISDDASFGSTVDTAVVPYPAYTPRTRLGYGTYYWRVRGRSGGSSLGDWSGAWRFQVAAQSYWRGSRTPGDADNRQSIASDPTGDMTDPNYDVSNLYAVQSKDNWHFGFSANATATDMTYALYLDQDHADGSGAPTDAMSLAVSTIAAHRPEYAIYTMQSGGTFTTSNVLIYGWNGSSWTSPQALDAIGGTLFYDAGSDYVEVTVPSTALATQEASAGSFAVSLFSAMAGGGHAQDTVPFDPGVAYASPDSSAVSTVLSRFASVSERLTTASPRTNAAGDPSDLSSVLPFFWNWPVDEPWEGFNLQVARDGAFTSVLGDYTLTANAPYLPLPSFTYSDNGDNGKDLPGDNTYYWRVRPIYSYPYPGSQHPRGAWSQPGRFDRRGFVAQNLTASVTFATPTFSWDMVEGAETYELQVDNDPGFGSLAVADSTARNSYTPIIPLANGTYYWRVRVHRNGSVVNDWSPAQTFTLSLPKPTGLTHDPAGVTDRAATLCWDPLIASADGDAILAAWKYRVQVSKGDPTFSSIYDWKDTEQNCWTPMVGYHDGTYYWRVAMIDGNNNLGDYSDAAQFTKQYPVTTLIGPASGSTAPTTPTFIWTPVDGAASYKLEISLFPNFSSIYATVTTNNSRYTPTTVYPAGNTYYWRVAIIDKNSKIGPYNNATIIVNTYPYRAFVPFISRE